MVELKNNKRKATIEFVTRLGEYVVKTYIRPRKNWILERKWGMKDVNDAMLEAKEWVYGDL